MTDQKRKGTTASGKTIAVWQCRHCGFKDTDKVKGWRRHNGRRYCRRCGKSNGWLM